MDFEMPHPETTELLSMAGPLLALLASGQRIQACLPPRSRPPSTTPLQCPWCQHASLRPREPGANDGPWFSCQTCLGTFSNPMIVSAQPTNRASHPSGPAADAISVSTDLLTAGVSARSTLPFNSTI
jgi:hypothetical protein